VHAGETFVRIGGSLDGPDERVSAVHYFHGNSSEKVLSGRNVKEVQVNGLVLAQNLPTAKQGDEGITDAPRGSSDTDSLGLFE
jgi:hypothetical protein